MCDGGVWGDGVSVSVRVRLYACHIIPAMPPVPTTCVWYTTCSDNIGHFDAVWDRGSLVAVNVGDRERWVAARERCVAVSPCSQTEHDQVGNDPATYSICSG